MLKIYSGIKYSKVTQMLDDETISLESVYVELIILKQKPRPVKYKDQTTYNEIAYLRKIASKEIKITPVNFTKELKSCTQEKPEIWCLIGNPGCGKTFLSMKSALTFSTSECI